MTLENEHLSYPSTSTEVFPTPSTTKDKESLKDRIFVGNLSPTVDEYTLLQLFSKFGAISKFDFLFHRSGPLKGKPRGYAFIEFEKSDNASRAVSATHEKPLRGRNLVVTYAHQAPDDYSSHGSAVRRKTLMESGRPTALSMLKDKTVKRDKTQDKIALMEAKLKQMEASSQPKPLPASLPLKPMFKPADAPLPPKPKSTLPSLPLPPKSKTSSDHARSTAKVSLPSKPVLVEKKKVLMSGVKILKRKPDGAM